MYIHIFVRIQMVGPPPGPPFEGGNVLLTKCGVEYIQRHAQKTR